VSGFCCFTQSVFLSSRLYFVMAFALACLKINIELSRVWISSIHPTSLRCRRRTSDKRRLVLSTHQKVFYFAWPRVEVVFCVAKETENYMKNVYNLDSRKSNVEKIQNPLRKRSVVNCCSFFAAQFASMFCAAYSRCWVGRI
jgi:hypothetical protein